jgi:hypothetical protein
MTSRSRSLGFVQQRDVLLVGGIKAVALEGAVASTLDEEQAILDGLDSEYGWFVFHGTAKHMRSEMRCRG